MKILVIAPFVMDAESLARREAQVSINSASSSMQFEFRSLEFGPKEYDSHLDWLIAEAGVVKAGMNAQVDGYDGICVDSLSDSGVNALRSIVNIPVVGAGQTSYLMAQMMGRRFGIVTQWDPWCEIYERGLAEYGLRDKCASIRSINVKPDVRALLSNKADQVIPLLVAAAQACIGDGADVILLGSTTMHEAYETLRTELAVPVVNPGPTSYEVLRSLIELAQSHSRGVFERAGEAAITTMSSLSVTRDQPASEIVIN